MADNIRAVTDRMFQDQPLRARFEQETGQTNANDPQYHVRWRAWAAAELRYQTFVRELGDVINKHRMEGESGDTPDFILGEYLRNCLRIFDQAVKARDKWYGNKGLSQQELTPPAGTWDAGAIREH